MDETSSPDPSHPSDPIEDRLSALETAVEELRENLLHIAILVRGKRSEPRPEQPGEPGEPAPTRRESPAPTRQDSPADPHQPRDLEKWLGQNALLVVGVLALVAAVGFMLKYAFDQGLISPAARVGAGLVAGLGIAAYGERLIRKGVSSFGGAMQGAGAAIVYLSIWAASGPYQFIPSVIGIGALAVLSAVVLLSSLRHSEAYLAGLGAAGAYLAPILLGEGQATGDILLAYSVAVSAGTMVVAVMKGWRATFLLVVFGFFILSIFARGGAGADDALWGLYLTLGGGALLTAALRRGWNFEGAVAWFIAFSIILIAADSIDGWRAWVFVVGPAALVWPTWRAELRSTERPSPILTTMFYASAMAWAVSATRALPAPSNAWPLAAAIVIGLLYVGPGLLRGNAALHVAGLGAVAVGIMAQWSWLGAAVGFAVLGVFAAISTRDAPLAQNRWIGPAALAIAAYALFGALEARPEDDPVLLGRWAGALYLVLGSAVAVAGPLWKKTEPDWESPAGLNLRTTTWLLAALVALSGGSVEIPAFVTERGGSELAAGLAMSVYWILFAGALLAFGLIKDRRAVRITGLAVAALAIGKVLFVDLAELRALYRVGSLAALAVIALLAARAYHQRE